MDELLLLSGNDIPFPEARLTIHQPRLREIAYITEQRFWPGCELLKFNKVARGLDYDDKIKVKDIKEWIPPNKTQEAYDELLYSLAEEMGYL